MTNNTDTLLTTKCKYIYVKLSLAALSSPNMFAVKRVLDTFIQLNIYSRWGTKLALIFFCIVANIIFRCHTSMGSRGSPFFSQRYEGLGLALALHSHTRVSSMVF